VGIRTQARGQLCSSINMRNISWLMGVEENGRKIVWINQDLVQPVSAENKKKVIIFLSWKCQQKKKESEIRKRFINQSAINNSAQTNT
jgi:hypothetical protein